MIVKSLLASIWKRILWCIGMLKAASVSDTHERLPELSEQHAALPALPVQCADTSAVHPTRLIIGEALWERLYEHLVRVTEEDTHPDEQLAFLLAGFKRTPLGDALLVCQLILASPDDFVHQSPGGLEPTPEFVAAAVKRCWQEHWCLIEVHSHPFDNGNATTFSSIDWNNDKEKMPLLADILPPPLVHATMVVGQNALDMHYYDRESEEIRPFEQLVIVGEQLRVIPTTSGLPIVKKKMDERYQRQEMFLGKAVQRKMAAMHVAIVGLGGLGSFVALQLAHLGIGHLILIDPDQVERTNLNRLLGAGVDDIGQRKVDVYARLIHTIAPEIEVTSLAISLTDRENAEARTYAQGADVLFGCVDNHGARRILNQIALRYLVPLIDGGSGVVIGEGEQSKEVEAVGGQVQVVLPGMGCLECRGYIDPHRASFDLAPASVQAAERAHGYGTDETAPSVISLNGVIASLQVSELLHLLAGQRLSGTAQPPISFYDALQRRIRPLMTSYDEGCPSCGLEGVTGFGDLSPIVFASDAPIGEPIPDLVGTD